MDVDVTRSVVRPLAARVEQEIRAYPRVYTAFYGVLTRNAWVRDLVGRTKAGVRGGGALAHASAVQEPTVLRERREAAVAARLGLRR